MIPKRELMEKQMLNDQQRLLLKVSVLFATARLQGEADTGVEDFASVKRIVVPCGQKRSLLS